MVVAALIQRGGKLLICQRRGDGRHGLKWEFPGGKVEPGETPRQALERELTEELGIHARIGPEIVRYEVHYPKRIDILLIFHLVTDFQEEPVNAIFEQIKWETLSSLPSYDFLDGDLDFIRLLACGDLRLP
jgi:8-oxo-dGTP diphosphatase